jgi:5'-nucleotidase
VALSALAATVPIVSGLDAGPVSAGGPATFELDIIHINDHHSRLTPDTVVLNIGGGTATFQRGGFPRVVAAIEQLRTDLAGANVATVHAGDAITGSLYYTLFKGEADAAMMNEVCFDVFALGNHEFDDSDAGLVSFLDDLADDPCGTDVISANVVPEIGTPLAPVAIDDYFAPYSIKDYGGEQVGFVGITVAQKTQVSSQPLDTTLFLDEVTTIQQYIDELDGMGIDKIIGVTHQGYDKDLAMVPLLSGLDAVVGGDSHSLLGDFAAYNLPTEGAYPTSVTDADAKEVCVVQAWQYSHVVGHLNIEFDEFGDVMNCSGTPYLLLGDVTATAGGATPESVGLAVAADSKLLQIAPDAGATATLQVFADQVNVLSGQVIGTVTAPIGSTRFPTTALPNGGQSQQLAADAYLARAFRADLSLQNSGGVRIPLPVGDLTIGKAYELLPFANTLFEIELTGAEIKLALEQGLGNVLDNAGSTGAYPYGSGIRWDIDASAAFGDRFSNIEVRPKGTTEWLPLEDTDEYVVVANSFMAGGGDGYQALEDAVDDGRGVDTFLDYGQSFIDWVEDELGGVVSPPTEFSTKSYTPAVVPGAPTSVTGVAGDEKVTVSWVAPVGTAFQPITGYTATASPGGAECTSVGTALTCEVTGLTNGTEYTFTVAAANLKGDSAASAASTGVTPVAVPDAPTAVTAAAADETATVSWTAPAADNGSAITGYTVTADPGGATCTTEGALTCDVTGLTNGTEYTFTVVATNGIGDSEASAPSEGVTPIGVADAPSKPTGVAGNKQVVLSWTAPADTGGTPITDYLVQYRSATDPTWITFDDGVSTATTATVTGLRNGVRYRFQVSAANIVEYGPFSAQSAVVTPRTTPGKPGKPFGVAGKTKVTLVWASPANNGGAAITDYVVQFRKVGATRWRTADDGVSSRTLATVTSLKPATRYEFRVAARNEAGRGAFSSTARVRTRA